MINLTNMWKACGGEYSQRPVEWMRLPKTKELMQSLEDKDRGKQIHKAANGEDFIGGIIPPLTEIKKGRYGGTFAHPVIGLAYAKYLSPDFHIWCNERLLETGLIEVGDEVDVFGSPILAVVTEDGAYVSPRHMCEAMGIDWKSQHRKINDDKVLSTCVVEMTTPLPGSNQSRSYTMLPLSMISGWLFKINPKRVAKAVEPKLLKYQAEAYAVLDALR